MVQMDALQRTIEFIQELERLKDIRRTAWTSQGKQESVAEHSWRLAVLALTLQDHFPEANINHVIHMLLIHDLGEAYDGDTSATIAVDIQEKLKGEESAFIKLLEPLPLHLQDRILDLWREYVAGITLEAKLAKALDKIETIIQHNQGDNPNDFDYAFNLNYGKDLVEYHPVLKALRDLVDNETIKNME